MKEIYNILSIDMDYILEPCINLYNDLVKTDNPNKVWDIVNQTRNIDKHLSYSDYNLRTIFDIFTKKLLSHERKDKVMFANNHDAILYELTKEEYYDKKFNIYNIDHHHDIAFNDQQRTDVDRYDLPSVGSWVWYLDKYKLIDNYYWIKNANSVPYEGPKLDCNYMDYTSIKQTDLENTEIDFIFVSNSPQWVPRKYDVFFDMLIDIYSNYTSKEIRVIDQFFCEGNKEKPYRKDR